MNLLDGGIASSFASIFGAYFLDGTLIHVTREEQADGDVVTSETEAPIKLQVDQLSEVARQAAGYTQEEQRIIVLQVNPDGTRPPKPTTDDEISQGEQRWTVASVDADPANSQWIIRGQAV